MTYSQTTVALLHGAGEEYKVLLERLRSLPPSSEAKVGDMQIHMTYHDNQLQRDRRKKTRC